MTLRLIGKREELIQNSVSAYFCLLSVCVLLTMFYKTASLYKSLALAAEPSRILMRRTVYNVHSRTIEQKT